MSPQQEEQPTLMYTYFGLSLNKRMRLNITVKVIDMEIDPISNSVKPTGMAHLWLR